MYTGFDAGGLTREWISVLSTALFDPKNELFTQFNKDDKQALVRTISDFFHFLHFSLFVDNGYVDTSTDRFAMSKPKKMCHGCC